MVVYIPMTIAGISITIDLDTL